MIKVGVDEDHANPFENVIIVSQYKDESRKHCIEYEDLDDMPYEMCRQWYSFCNDDDVRRIFHPQDGTDYILKLNANYVAFNTRLWRYFCISLS